MIDLVEGLVLAGKGLARMHLQTDLAGRVEIRAKASFSMIGGSQGNSGRPSRVVLEVQD